MTLFDFSSASVPTAWLASMIVNMNMITTVPLPVLCWRDRVGTVFWTTFMCGVLN